MENGTRKKTQENSGAASDRDHSGDLKLPYVNNYTPLKKSAEQPTVRP